VHDPPRDFAYPDAVFPTPTDGLVVTELDPGWIDILTEDGRSYSLARAVRVAGLSAPYDANEVSANELIATDHADPGAVEEFSSSGRVLWRYAPRSGPGRLREPTLAEVLPDHDVLDSDAGNDRVIVIDPKTKAIVWQYGHRGVPGRLPGYLHTPDSAVVVPAAAAGS
jgi:hypothetical protein